MEWSGSPLPADYQRLLHEWAGLRMTYSDDRFQHLRFCTVDDLAQRQLGYAVHGLTGEPIEGWPPAFLVIADDAADPYCLDLSRDDTAVFFAYHGEGLWDWTLEYPSLQDFVADLPPGLDGWAPLPGAQSATWDRLVVTGWGADRAAALRLVRNELGVGMADANRLIDEASVADAGLPIPRRPGLLDRAERAGLPFRLAGGR